MNYKLFKLSEPGWELDYSTRKEVEYKLLTCLCSECKEETMDDIKEGYDPVDTMLSTACGCEYDLEEVHDKTN